MSSQRIKLTPKMRKTRNVRDILKQFKKYTKRDQEFHAYINQKLGSNPGLFPELLNQFQRKNYQLERTELPNASNVVQIFSRTSKPKYTYRVYRILGEPTQKSKSRTRKSRIEKPIKDSPDDEIKIFPESTDLPDTESSSISLTPHDSSVSVLEHSPQKEPKEAW